MNDGFVNRKYEEFYSKYGYIPSIFNPYNCSEINDYSPTMTTQCGSTTSSSTVLIKEDNMNKLIQVGQLEGKHEQSNRVYNSDGIAPTLTCASAENERYMVDECNHLYGLNKLTNKGVDNMWNNNLEKLNFEMEEIRIFDIFAGIGALHQSLKELGVPVRVTNLSEVDVDATISYAAGHIDNFKDLEFEYPSVEEMRQWLIDRNIGYSFEKNKSSVPRMKVEKLKLAYKANVLLNNLGDISKIDYDKIEDFDLMNMSFPCTDLSNAGQQRGMKNEDGTPTRSGLYVYSIKAVRAKKPKYVMIENVKALIQKKFIEDFYSVISELEECGYNCYYPTKEDKKGVKPICLNSKDFGIPQNRERIFVIAIRKDIDTKIFEFPVGRDYGVRLKDVLEDQVDEKYYLSPEIQNKISNWKAYQRPFENVLGENSTSPTITARGAGEYHSGMVLVGEGLKDKTNLEDNKIICEQRSDEGLRFFKDNICGTLRTIDACGDKRVIENGAIRGRYNENGKIEQQLELRNDGVTNTLTTVEKDNVIVKNVSFNNKSEIRIRKLTPLECWRLMGFRDEAFYKAQELGVSDSQLYKQAGNSIVVNCLYYIFKNLFKEYIK